MAVENSYYYLTKTISAGQPETGTINFYASTVQGQFQYFGNAANFGTLRFWNFIGSGGGVVTKECAVCGFQPNITLWNGVQGFYCAVSIIEPSFYEVFGDFRTTQFPINQTNQQLYTNGFHPNQIQNALSYELSSGGVQRQGYCQVQIPELAARAYIGDDYTLFNNPDRPVDQAVEFEFSSSYDTLIDHAAGWAAETQANKANVQDMAQDYMNLNALYEQAIQELNTLQFEAGGGRGTLDEAEPDRSMQVDFPTINIIPSFGGELDPIVRKKAKEILEQFKARAELDPYFAKDTENFASFNPTVHLSDNTFRALKRITSLDREDSDV